MQVMRLPMSSILKHLATLQVEIGLQNFESWANFFPPLSQLRLLSSRPSVGVSMRYSINYITEIIMSLGPRGAKE